MEKSVEQNLEKLGLATKQDLLVSKQETNQRISDLKVEFKQHIAALKIEFKQDMAGLRNELAQLETKLTRAIYINGLIQFLAIVGSVLAILNFVKK